MSKLILALLFLAVLLFAGYVVMNRHVVYAPSPVNPLDTILNYAIPPSFPSDGIKKDTQTTFYGKLSGESYHAHFMPNTPSFPHFEQTTKLKANGFIPDNNLSADGAGSSTWGYIRTIHGAKQIITFSYTFQPTNSNPNQPLQFNCPCRMDITVFVSDPFSPTSLANPASVNCTKVGGTLIIKKRGDGGEYGLCDFGDNMQCEEWALFKGDCPVGGRKTTGYDETSQKYCAWLGGTTYAVPNATCKLPNGHTCLDTALYNGTCQ